MKLIVSTIFVFFALSQVAARSTNENDILDKIDNGDGKKLEFAKGTNIDVNGKGMQDPEKEFNPRNNNINFGNNFVNNDQYNNHNNLYNNDLDTVNGLKFEKGNSFGRVLTLGKGFSHRNKNKNDGNDEENNEKYNDSANKGYGVSYDEESGLDTGKLINDNNYVGNDDENNNNANRDYGVEDVLYTGKLRNNNNNDGNDDVNNDKYNNNAKKGNSVGYGVGDGLNTGKLININNNDVNDNVNKFEYNHDNNRNGNILNNLYRLEYGCGNRLGCGLDKRKGFDQKNSEENDDINVDQYDSIVDNLSGLDYGCGNSLGCGIGKRELLGLQKHSNGNDDVKEDQYNNNNNGNGNVPDNISGLGYGCGYGLGCTSILDKIKGFGLRSNSIEKDNVNEDQNNDENTRNWNGLNYVYGLVNGSRNAMGGGLGFFKGILKGLGLQKKENGNDNVNEGGLGIRKRLRLRNINNGNDDINKDQYNHDNNPNGNGLDNVFGYESGNGVGGFGKRKLLSIQNDNNDQETNSVNINQSNLGSGPDEALGTDQRLETDNGLEDGDKFGCGVGSGLSESKDFGFNNGDFRSDNVYDTQFNKDGTDNPSKLEINSDLEDNFSAKASNLQNDYKDIDYNNIPDEYNNNENRGGLDSGQRGDLIENGLGLKNYDDFFKKKINADQYNGLDVKRERGIGKDFSLGSNINKYGNDNNKYEKIEGLDDGIGFRVGFDLEADINDKIIGLHDNRGLGLGAGFGMDTDLSGKVFDFQNNNNGNEIEGIGMGVGFGLGGDLSGKIFGVKDDNYGKSEMDSGLGLGSGLGLEGNLTGKIFSFKNKTDGNHGTKEGFGLGVGFGLGGDLNGKTFGVNNDIGKTIMDSGLGLGADAGLGGDLNANVFSFTNNHGKNQVTEEGYGVGVDFNLNAGFNGKGFGVSSNIFGNTETDNGYGSGLGFGLRCEFSGKAFSFQKNNNDKRNFTSQKANFFKYNQNNNNGNTVMEKGTRLLLGSDFELGRAIREKVLGYINKNNNRKVNVNDDQYKSNNNGNSIAEKESEFNFGEELPLNEKEVLDPRSDSKKNGNVNANEDQIEDAHETNEERNQRNNDGKSITEKESEFINGKELQINKEKIFSLRSNSNNYGMGDPNEDQYMSNKKGNPATKKGLGFNFGQGRPLSEKLFDLKNNKINNYDNFNDDRFMKNNNKNPVIKNKFRFNYRQGRPLREKVPDPVTNKNNYGNVNANENQYTSDDEGYPATRKRSGSYFGQEGGLSEKLFSLINKYGNVNVNDDKYYNNEYPVTENFDMGNGKVFALGNNRAKYNNNFQYSNIYSNGD